ncbi:putative acid phosphatase [Aspergillus ruber CBS 135680]|uniref:Phosphoglycerate mutase-like protein n=1 Tax=Aspergillus ruber (strain CBS 135680) TaxID=1388766 RepID=A0A017SQI4_ASPRC|nr:phosphoglycerate mutase-like protein [Aspergillus ruber CBS 135680]EYE98874.1 phosphoglycerate mutase-like protein [Aspergillus ruber CBS 135680]
MTSLVPREAYSQDELDQLYPKDLKLELVQVFLRHGERTPVSARFQNTGLAAYWPYCNVARRMIQMATSSQDMSTWDSFAWRRKMETFGGRDEAVVAQGAQGEIEGICQPGELTDKGRETTFALGQRLRRLYVDQLGFMPEVKSDAEDMYLRTTPLPRALESLQQAFFGMYPRNARTLDFPPPVIVARSISEETLLPNEGNCRRFRQLARLFADRAAKRWNDTDEMAYLNTLWSKWMPANSPTIAVDAHPRLSGINDTINATYAHGPATKLPREFYDAKARAITDKIASDEWYSGYQESNEYRRLGIGGLMGDVVDRMVSTAVDGGWRSETSPSGSAENGKAIKFAMSGCHDTTLAAILGSLDAFDGRWPPFTSSVAIELFTKTETEPQSQNNEDAQLPKKTSSFFSGLLDGSSTSTSSLAKPSTLSRNPLSVLPDSARRSMQEKHYVRVRYNDRPMRIPGCAAKPENHLPGNDTFCTLDAFKDMVDKFTPQNWMVECTENLGEGLYGKDDVERVKRFA